MPNYREQHSEPKAVRRGELLAVILSPISDRGVSPAQRLRGLDLCNGSVRS